MSPNRSFLLPALVLFLTPAIAGCIEAQDDLAATDDPVQDLVPAEATTDLEALVIPAWDALPSLGEWARDWTKDYATTYHNRISFTPVNDAANNYLKTELEALGFETRLIEYGSEADPGAGPTYKVVEAVRKGTVEPEKHIGLIAHHDARYSSNEAAYDDASGTAVVMAIAKYVSEIDTRKSVSVLMFDGEEMGLRSSCYYANDVVRGDAPMYDIAFGYDMIGINYPGHEWDMYLMQGDADDLEVTLPLSEEVIRDRLQLPEDGVTILDVHDRNSDERRFREIGLPIYRWAGGRHAGDYPHYHQPTDTYENMVAFVDGDEANLASGFDTAVRSSIAMLHAADQYDFPEYTLAEKPCSFYGPDDGPL